MKSDLFSSASNILNNLKIYNNKGQCSTECMNSIHCFGIAILRSECSILEPGTDLNALNNAGWKLYSIKN